MSAVMTGCDDVLLRNYHNLLAPGSPNGVSIRNRLDGRRRLYWVADKPALACIILPPGARSGLGITALAQAIPPV